MEPRIKTQNFSQACQPNFSGSPPREILSSLEGTSGNVWEQRWVPQVKECRVHLVSGRRKAGALLNTTVPRTGPRPSRMNLRSGQAEKPPITEPLPAHLCSLTSCRPPCQPLKAHHTGSCLVPVPLQACSGLTVLGLKCSPLIVLWASPSLGGSPLKSSLFIKAGFCPPKRNTQPLTVTAAHFNP